MLFTSPTFLCWFLPAVIALDFLIRPQLRNPVLLAASLLFYWWGELEIVRVMAQTIASTWLFGLLVDCTRTRRARVFWLSCGIGVALSHLLYYKYSGFFVDNLRAVAGADALAGFVAPTLPIGISFFVFQAISYLVDVYRGDAPVQRSPVPFALYIALFPQLIAGPIVRYSRIAADLTNRSQRLGDVAAGIRRFVLGLGKKVLVANVLSVPADAVFAANTADLTAPVAGFGLLCYGLQIYFDFSGYSDMAIGIGRMLGFHFDENFLHPYVSRSITEFWRRWHVSLSSWFRDYLYIPLGGNRHGRARTYANLLIVFFLCGLWHGAAFSFIVWGLWHGAFLVMERALWSGRLDRSATIVRRAYTLAVVVVGWVFFRSDSLAHAAAFLRALVGLGSGDGLVEHVGLHYDAVVGLALVAGCVGSTPWLARAQERCDRRSVVVREFVRFGGDVVVLVILALSVSFIAGGTANPFIYFRF